jgi:hypothetical protein
MGAETRIALIGVVGALAGTLVGGLVTYAVTQQQISSQKAESRRTERLDAYSAYFGDSTKFWIDASTITEAGLHPKSITASQRTNLNSLAQTLIGEYARVSLLAPPRVRAAAKQLINANIDILNELGSGSIEYGPYERTLRRVQGKDSLLSQFDVAMRADLGTS